MILNEEKRKEIVSKHKLHFCIRETGHGECLTHPRNLMLT